MAAATRRFVSDLIGERTSVELFSMGGAVTYYVLHGDFERIRAGLNLDSEITILTGLLSQKNLSVVKPEALFCNPVGRLTRWPQAILELAICYGRALFCAEEATRADEDVFGANMIALLREEQDKIAWIINKVRAHGIVGHWMLTDGGIQRPREILAGAFVTAREIIIYDRYFRTFTLDAVMDAIEFARAHRGEPLGCDITICVGDSGRPGDVGYLEYAGIPAVLNGFVEAGKLVTVEKVVRPRSRGLWLHDRFIQIDRSSTFVFTAGIGCFFEGRGVAGPNRSCHIFELAISDDWEEFDFEVENGERRERRNIRT